MNCRLKRVGRLILIKNTFQSAVFLINKTKGPDKESNISRIESTVNKALKPFQLLLTVIHDKVVGSIAKQSHHLLRAFDYCHPLSPGNGSSQKAGNFNVLLRRKQVWYLYRIGFYKLRAIVETGLFIKKFP